MLKTSRSSARLSEQEAAEVEAARAAARARFAHLAEDDGDDEVGHIPGPVDPDNPPMTDAELARLRPAAEVIPTLVAASLRKGGRPRSAAPKVAVSIRLDPEVLEALRSSGAGWQGRVNAMLRRTFGLDRPEPPAADNIDRAAQNLAEEAERLEAAIRLEIESVDRARASARRGLDEDEAELARIFGAERPRAG